MKASLRISLLACSAFAALAPVLSSCSKDSGPASPVVETSSIKVEFDNVAGDVDLTLGSTTMTTGSGEQFTPTALKYFVSNIQLVRSDGGVETLPQDRCYFLVDEAVASSRVLSLPDVPVGSYSRLRFILGVDSARSVSPVERRGGSLDPAGAAADMYWVWNSGYIFFKLEGDSPNAPVGKDGNRRAVYHLGGYGGYETATINNIKTIDLPLPSVMNVKKGETREVHIYADIAKVFDGPTPFRIADRPMVMFMPFSTTVSANTATMFSVDHVH